MQSIIISFSVGKIRNLSFQLLSFRFDPDRFSPENAKKIPAMAFPTFGVGARRCPGYHFSRYEVMTAVSILCKRYELRPAFDTDYFVEPNYGFVTKPETEIWIKLRKRY